MIVSKSDRDIQTLIDKAHEAQAESPRAHMGASILGHPCDRWLWLSFRWAVQQQFPGRVLRMFRRGQNEEATILDDLRAVGIKIESTQQRVNFGSHVSGSLDAVIKSGVPEAPKARHIAEFKTHNKKSFEALEKDGVERFKPEHFVQMQVYMAGTKIDRALYVAACKDDDRIYTERVRFDKAVAQKAVERGQRIALSDWMPEPISSDPSWFQCKFCPAHEFCHQTKITKHVNCRTCAHATAKEDSTWRCERHDADAIPVEFQRTGCGSHVLHPDLVPWKRKPSNDPHEAVYEIAGKDIRNGEGDAFTFSSQELVIGGDACANDLVQKVRETFPGAEIKNRA